MSGLDLLSLGLDLMGGMMDRHDRKKAQAASERQFNQQLKEAVQWRVADAKKAGVHPLFALGASVGASPTISTSSQTGGMGDALSRMAATLGVIDQNRASAKRDEAEAAYLDAQTAKLRQRLESTNDAGKLSGSSVKTYPLPASAGPYTGNLEVIPAQQIAAKPTNRGVEGGDHPLRRDYVDDTGQLIRGFSSESQMDEISQGKIAAAKARWIAEWKIYEATRGRGRRAAQARRWILRNTSDTHWKQVTRRLRRVYNESVKAGRRRKPVFRVWKERTPTGGGW